MMIMKMKARNKQHDEEVDKALADLGVLKGLAKDFNVEAKKQVALTAKLNERVELTEAKMVKVDNKLTKIIVNSNNSRVQCYIVVQVVIFIFLLIIG